jgi:hypothetical protein
VHAIALERLAVAYWYNRKPFGATPRPRIYVARFGRIDEWHELRRKPFRAKDLNLQRAVSPQVLS